jgi:hypothetical protein
MRRMSASESVLTDFDFSLLDNPEFKEDSVREDIIMPLLGALGYSSSGKNRVIRSKTVSHPFVKVGTKRRKLTNYPDYILEVDGRYVFVLDAKGPDEDINPGSKNVEQIYFYAIHPEIRVSGFALCNGREFIIFNISREQPLLRFNLSDIDKYWEELQSLLSPGAFTPRVISARAEKVEDFDYIGVRPPTEIRSIERQTAKRHFGVHGYFTKQAWKIVHAYIERFSRPGDVVLDPYGGTGVTLIESLILGRKGINIDLNPLSIFMVKNLLAPVDFGELAGEYEKVVREFTKGAPRTPQEVKAALRKYPYPKNIPLMRNADVDSIEKLFHPGQLAQLAYLKHLILRIKNANIRGTLLLMFSGLINKINLTYHASGERSEGRGDSSVFRYYRFRLAPRPAFLDLMKYFDSRFQKVVAAKREIAASIKPELLKQAEVYQGTATDLSKIDDESIDYIYTDPPYGAKIPYLDLSIMFTAWLDLPIRKKDYELEAIEGGELEKSKEDYSALISESILEMYRVLKLNRWMSFVFAHKDPAYWHMIVETAERAGFEYAGAIPQKTDRETFKKRQNPFTVLHGQLIINFKKVENPKTIMRVSLGADIADIVIQTIEGIIAKNHGATIDEINDELIIKGLELGFLDILGKEYQDVTPTLREQFDYDTSTEKYHLRKNTKFKANIDVSVRISYYLVAYMRRMAHQHHNPTFDEIVLHIMPLLKNGKTPERQTIQSVLEELSERVGEDSYRLRTEGQQHLFDGH